MSSRHQTTGARWNLDAPLELEWRKKALCRHRRDLPWTPDVEPDPAPLFDMRDLCQHCPVIRECAAFGLSQPGGFYAGVWTPWADSGPSSERTRSKRYAARNSLRAVRDSATPRVNNTPTAKDRDVRPLSLSTP